MRYYFFRKIRYHRHSLEWVERYNRLKPFQSWFEIFKNYPSNEKNLFSFIVFGLTSSQNSLFMLNYTSKITHWILLTPLIESEIFKIYFQNSKKFMSKKICFCYFFWLILSFDSFPRKIRYHRRSSEWVERYNRLKSFQYWFEQF